MADSVLNTSISNIQDVNRVDTQADTDRKKLADDFDQFLLLLTTQLKNQDPTEPMDTNEFTNQLVQFASVEQQIAANQNLETLVSIGSRAGVDSSIGYIGKAIEASGNAGILENGQAAFTYDLASVADAVKVTVTDASGVPVFSGDGSTSSGSNVVSWDGVNSFTGEQMPDGDYRISVIATNSAGDEIAAQTHTTGRVSAVELDGAGGTVLVVGNLRISTDDVTAVREL